MLPASPPRATPAQKRPRLDWATALQRTEACPERSRGGIDVWTCHCGAQRTVCSIVTNKDQLADDLVFKAAAPIAGGIPEVMVTAPAKENRFQGRYIVRKPFDLSQCERYDRQAMGFTPVGSALAGPPGEGDLLFERPA